MFQLTTTQSKTLLRNTLSRYRTKLHEELHQTLEEIYRSAEVSGEGYDVTIMRIHITGNAGSGKTTLAKELGSILSLEVYGLDHIVWKPDWEKTPLDERRRLEQELVAKPKWIIEGVSSVIRKSSDTIVFLDLPRYRCFFRCAKRNWKYLFKSRPELPENCPEIKIIPLLIKIIWQFPKVTKPYILEDFGKENFIRITNNTELNDFINKVKYNKSNQFDALKRASV